MPARVRTTLPPLDFDKKLVLQQWVFLPTLSDLPVKKLKIVRVPEHLSFKRDAPKPSLEPDRGTFLRSPESYIGKMFEFMLAVH